VVNSRFLQASTAENLVDRLSRDSLLARLEVLVDRLADPWCTAEVVSCSAAAVLRRRRHVLAVPPQGHGLSRYGTYEHHYGAVLIRTG